LQENEVMSNFDFLHTELFTGIKQDAKKAEGYVLSDPLVAGIYLRRALESAVKWMYQNDEELPYLGDLNKAYNRYLTIDELLNREDCRSRHAL
jgi:hypothetical protein